MLSLLIALSASAATYDPELRWRTIETEHFNLHFHQGEERLAEEFSFLMEEVYDTMTDEMLWTPRRRTEVVLVDRTDSANGSAGVIPYNAITIYVTHPQGASSLSLYESWPEALFTHELTHVLHLDTQHAWVRMARWVVGRVATSNTVSPRWMVEGLATLQETRHTSGGRGRAPLVDMLKRTSVLADDIPPIGNLDGYQADPPGGNLRYVYAQDFMQYVADERGDQVWTRWTHTYGSGIPFVLPSRRVFGRELVPMYQDYKRHITERYEAQLAPVRAEGVREGRVVSEPSASCAAPAFSPNGEHLVWSCNHLDIGSRIWMADGSGYAPEVLLVDRGASSFTWRSDSEAFVYAGLHIVNRFNTWSDVWMHTLGSDTVRSLTSAKRARDPEFSPDGTELLVVTNLVGTNQIQAITVDQQMRERVAFDDDTQIGTPRYSPDGSHIVASVWQAGRRDLWLFDRDGQQVRKLTHDSALDMQPRWSADGRWLYFASDASGIPNIYAIEIATERLWQVSNVLTGALEPSVSPDGKHLAYAQYANSGWQVRVMDLDPSAFIDRGSLPSPLLGAPSLAELIAPVDTPVITTATALCRGEATEGRRSRLDLSASWAQEPGDGVDTFEQLDVDGVYGDEIDFPFSFPARRYNPLPMLVPRYVLPYFQTTPYASKRFGFLPFGVQASLSTSASDVLRHLQYSASLNYRTDADFFGGSAAITLNRFLPLYTLSVSRRAVPFPQYEPDPLHIGEDGVPLLSVLDTPYWERRTTFVAQVSYPYRPKTTVFANYTLTARDAKDGLSDQVYRARIPVRGTIGRLSGGWRYSWTRPTRLAISTEDGRVFGVVASLTHPLLGTLVRGQDDIEHGITQAQLTAELREYRVNPLIPNHVVAFRAAAGVTVGQDSFLGNYQLGGSFGDGGLSATPDEFRMLRGYPLAADVGDSYWLSGLEYRFPIWRIDRGFRTLPVFLRYLSASVFADAGNAVVNPTSPMDIVEGTLVGVGAELRLASIVGWSSGLSGRLGYGAALTPGGYRLGDPRGVYLRVGGSF